jgi:hypothetical protein
VNPFTIGPDDIAKVHFASRIEHVSTAALNCNSDAPRLIASRKPARSRFLLHRADDDRRQWAQLRLYRKPVGLDHGRHRGHADGSPEREAADLPVESFA